MQSSSLFACVWLLASTAAFGGALAGCSDGNDGPSAVSLLDAAPAPAPDGGDASADVSRGDAGALPDGPTHDDAGDAGDATVSGDGGGPPDAESGDTSANDAPEDALTTQNDPKNCGAVGHDCRGAVCSEGQCAPEHLADAQDSPEMIGFVDDTNLYFQAPFLQTIPKAGGAVERIASGGTSFALSGDTFVLLTEMTDRSPLEISGVAKTARNANPTVYFEIENAAPPYTYIDDFDIRGSTLYGINGCNEIYTLPLQPNATLGRPYSDGCNSTNEMTRILVDDGANYAYITSDAFRAIYEYRLSDFQMTKRVSLPSSTPGATRGDAAQGVTRTGHMLYWLTTPDTTSYVLYAMSVDDFTPVKLATIPNLGVGMPHMLSDEHGLYIWSHGYEIWELPLAPGATPFKLHESSAQLQVLAVDEHWLYYAAQNYIGRVAK